jgi:hypothetical protein
MYEPIEDDGMAYWGRLLVDQLKQQVKDLEKLETKMDGLGVTVSKNTIRLAELSMLERKIDKVDEKLDKLMALGVDVSGLKAMMKIFTTILLGLLTALIGVAIAAMQGGGIP